MAIGTSHAAETACGVAEIAAPVAVLAVHERIHVPHRKRLSHAYVTSEDGERVLRLDYGLKEVTFHEARYFALGEALAREPSFTGEEAMAWGGYAWDELAPMLEHLLGEGILARGEPVEYVPGGLVESPLPPAPCAAPRMWSAADCEAITRELGGRAVEIGYLETFVTSTRVAHPAIDGDGRQVGEANVYPPRLRVEQPTEWRTCQYPGSRYRDPAPMNVTALKAMIKHWKPIVAVVLAVRDELAARLPARTGAWTIGELHMLSTVILALPAYPMMKGGGRSPQPPVHPVLSSLFRITDGIRMVSDEMMFSVEHRHAEHETMTAADVYHRAEQHGLLIGTTGVCAGPRAMIEELLAAAIDGVRPAGLDGVVLGDELTALLGELPAAIDYGLYGVQAWAVSRSVWPAMSRAFEAVLAFVDDAEAIDLADAARVRDGLATGWHDFAVIQLANDHDRDVHERGYAGAYARSWRASRVRIGQPVLDDELALAPTTAQHDQVAAQLRAALAARFRGEPAIDRLVAALVHYLRIEQAVTAAAERIQAAINALLDRPRPTRPLCVRDLHLFHALSVPVREIPYLFDVLERALALRIESTATTLTIIDQRV